MRKHIHELILGAGLVALLCSAVSAEAAPPKSIQRPKATPKAKLGPEGAGPDFTRARVPQQAPYEAPNLQVTDSIKTFGLIKRYDDDMILVGHPISNPSPEHLKMLGVVVVQSEQKIAPNTIYQNRIYRAYQVATDGPVAAMIARRLDTEASLDLVRLSDGQLLVKDIHDLRTGK